MVLEKWYLHKVRQWSLGALSATISIVVNNLSSGYPERELKGLGQNNNENMSGGSGQERDRERKKDRKIRQRQKRENNNKKKKIPQ